MKILIAWVLFYSFLAEADYGVQEISLLKSFDGQLVTCESSRDLYRGLAYFTKLNVWSVDANGVGHFELERQAVLCEQLSDGTFVWKKINIVNGYSHPILIFNQSGQLEQRQRRVKFISQKLLVLDSEENILLQPKLFAKGGADSYSFSLNIEEFIRPEQLQQLKQGQEINGYIELLPGGIYEERVDGTNYFLRDDRSGGSFHLVAKIMMFNNHINIQSVSIK